MSQATGTVEDRFWPGRLSAKAVGPLLFGLRLWASVCLALYVAFALQLNDPSWAGTTAALVCQPQLGASLRKGSFRLIGTAAGGAAIVVIAALFPQDRVGFLAGLALWSAACGFAGGLLKNFAAYGAGLAGFTAGVIAGDVFSPAGGANDQVVVTLAITRMIEIALGIVCAGVVLALTDLGAARRRLGVEFASIAAGVLSGLAGAVSAPNPLDPAARAARREIMRRVIALDPMIDTALGEASDLRYRSRILQAGVGGLITTISAWRSMALHLGAEPRTEDDDVVGAVEAILQRLATTPEDAERGAPGLRDACDAAAKAAVRIEARSPASQLLATAAAAGAIGAARAFNGLTLIVDPRRTRREDALARLHIPDWLPPTVVAVRAFVTVGVASLFWIATAWSSGPLAITFAIIVAVLFPLQGDRAYSAALIFLFGCVLSAALAAILMFGVLPAVTTFPGLCLALGARFASARRSGRVAVATGVFRRRRHEPDPVPVAEKFDDLRSGAIRQYRRRHPCRDGGRDDPDPPHPAALSRHPHAPAARLCAGRRQSPRRGARDAVEARLGGPHGRPDGRPPRRGRTGRALQDGLGARGWLAGHPPAHGRAAVRLRRGDRGGAAAARRRARAGRARRPQGARSRVDGGRSGGQHRPAAARGRARHVGGTGGVSGVLRSARPGMSFGDVDVFGLYVAPAAPILLIAAVAFVVLRRATEAFGILRRVWHPALFEFAIYAILASGLTLWLANRGG